MSKSRTTIYRIKVTLQHVPPPIWRHIEVPGDIQLGKLHRILQATMGWYDAHLHVFRVGDTTYGVPDSDSLFDTEMENECNARLAKFRKCWQIPDILLAEPPGYGTLNLKLLTLPNGFLMLSRPFRGSGLTVF